MCSNAAVKLKRSSAAPLARSLPFFLSEAARGGTMRDTVWSVTCAEYSSLCRNRVVLMKVKSGITLCNTSSGAHVARLEMRSKAVLCTCVLDVVRTHSTIRSARIAERSTSTALLSLRPLTTENRQPSTRPCKFRSLGQFQNNGNATDGGVESTLVNFARLGRLVVQIRATGHCPKAIGCTSLRAGNSSSAMDLRVWISSTLRWERQERTTLSRLTSTERVRRDLELGTGGTRTRVLHPAHSLRASEQQQNSRTCERPRSIDLTSDLLIVGGCPTHSLTLVRECGQNISSRSLSVAVSSARIFARTEILLHAARAKKESRRGDFNTFGFCDIPGWVEEGDEFTVQLQSSRNTTARLFPSHTPHTNPPETNFSANSISPAAPVRTASTTIAETNFAMR
ncbi:hypothetical protein KC328_g21 [Hortaea werneckii]|nr:hypothetical protein KC328_g21 [Hortaea werneckii]